MTKDEALKLALEAFDSMIGRKPERVEQAITAIKEALAQPEQEPVAWVSTTELLVMRGNALGGAKEWRISLGLVKQDGDVGLYTTPPQRKPLTDEEILADETLRYYFGLNGGAGPVSKQGRRIVNAIEAAHGIKENT